MCDCFIKLAEEVKRVAQEEYPNREILGVSVGQGWNPKKETSGHIEVSVTFRSSRLNSKGEYGIFRRNNIGYKNYSKSGKRSLDADWKYCPLCGRLL